MKARKWTKAALAFSICLFIFWWALGATATLAWFSDTDVVRNHFQVGLLRLGVDFKNDIITDYTNMEGSSEVFNDQALYEPGYTQVVYLRIDNLGDMDFNYKLSVTVEDSQIGRNAWGEPIYLPNYLRYGVVFGTTEAEVQAQVKDRLTARDTDPGDVLGTWSQISPYTFKTTDEYHYAALIVYMPEEIGNVANYRGVDPWVKLGITVFAQQANAELKP